MDPVSISLLKHKVGQSCDIQLDFRSPRRIRFLRHRQDNREQRLFKIVDASSFQSK